LAATTNVSHHQAGAPMSVSDIYGNARALRNYLLEKSPEIDEARRLPSEVAARLRDAGMFRLAMPKIWGGPELSTIEQIEVIEEISRGNAAAGWCVMIGCDSGFFSAHLADDVGRRLYPRLDMATAGQASAAGIAEKVAGGYQVSGNFAFASGITHADVVIAGCIVKEEGSSVPEVSKPRWMLIPVAECEILDTWHTTGLRGTGSNDFRLSSLIVPEERSFSFFAPTRRDTTLYRNSNTFLPKVSGVPLGAARAMIDLVSETMQTKVEFPTGRPYKSIPRIQSAIAEAEMILGAARSYVFSATEREWERLESREPLTDGERADVWLCRVNVAHAARKIIRMLYDAVGGSAIYARKGPFDRALRDAETWCQHVVVQRRTLEHIGARLLKTGGSPFPFL
jgi:alkylation response protein AidB-like acyl-CoA dehydrogenase